MRFFHARWIAILLVVLAGAMVCEAQQNGTSPGNGSDSRNFSDADAEKLMGTIADGFVGHSADKLLSAFDADRMSGYQAFADDVRRFFQKYENFRVHYQILNVSTSNAEQKPIGLATAEFELQGDDIYNQTPGITRSAQVQFTCELSKGGWKATSISPAGLFQ